MKRHQIDDRKPPANGARIGPVPARRGAKRPEPRERRVARAASFAYAHGQGPQLAPQMRFAGIV